ncbi:hypothetical protein [Planctellipticum variicoloris]|uniref:hypothetical protein n=1 Tax=Planctellipticum variicoloris TaxID=3064265 RepID=UPI003013BEF8|nr:zinc-ribbon domain-containing protein [Planctomycetaceae bacterium SH412]
MSILTACPNCQKSFRVESAAVGKTARCGGCGSKFRVTEVMPVPTAAVAPKPPPALEAALAGLGRVADESPAADVPLLPDFDPAPPPPFVPQFAQAMSPPAMGSRGGITFQQTLILVVVFGVVCSVAGVGAWSMLRPRTFVEELKAAPKDPQALAKQIQQQIQANRGVKHFHGKEVPFNGALVVSRHSIDAEVSAYEDTSSWLPVSGSSSEEYDDRMKKGWIIKLPPMLAVKLLETSTHDVFTAGYRYKGNLDFEKTLYRVEILEGPRKGQKWWIHVINLVKDTDDMDLEERMRDPERQKGKLLGERQLDALLGAPGGK